MAGAIRIEIKGERKQGEKRDEEQKKMSIKEKNITAINRRNKYVIY